MVQFTTYQKYDTLIARCVGIATMQGVLGVPRVGRSIVRITAKGGIGALTFLSAASQTDRMLLII
jgi:hypothetical protein